MKQIRNLGLENSIFNQYIAELRDEIIQKDPIRFRRNLERLGEIFAYEISKTFTYHPVEVTTPLGTKTMQLMQEQPVLATILRAGLPLHQGMLNIFDHADNAFISAFRKHYPDGSFDIQVGYMSSPDMEDRVLILCDPMLASGQSMVCAYNDILAQGKPKYIHVVSVIASTFGVQYLHDNLPDTDCTIWLGAVDDELTAQSYIVPGLGDAGDLAYGCKTDSVL
ncbi:MAG: uracil phosphoribosyltransferase [Bacteroidales bacterium]|jgi:uracil phosphoribosyltransferase|nr:uracil phosphoribosyltransferase [Bacteroidales bacterium]MCR5115420.1 uracil phosphoribosyltransferase [Bacteroidales bacterium]